MLLLLLPSAWLGLFFLIRAMIARGQTRTDWRYAFVLASAWWGALISFGTEILSLGTLLNAPCVRIFWLFLNAVLWGGLGFVRRRSPTENGARTFACGWKELRAWPLDALLMLGAAGLFAIFLGGIALLTPTTNWDSLTYHMARVMHWVQQGSVAHYPTNMEGQVQMGPWSGFVQAHLWLLWGNDRFENMVQWSAMAGSTVAATLLVCQLLPSGSATSARAQAFAALLIVTLPTGIVESITTQTDYTTGFWLMCLASLGLAWLNEPANRAYAIGFGVTLGLGVLTKFTMVFYAAPIGVAVATIMMWKQRRTLTSVLLPGIGALAICLALVAPHFIRNQIVFGSAIGSQAVRHDAGIAHLSLGGVLSNMIHNAELHSNTGIESLTHQLNRVAHTMLGWTGRGPRDLELAESNSMSEPPDEFFVFDSFAASPWHVALIVVAVVAGFASWRKNRLPLAGLGFALAGFTLFCMGIRWQMWNSRYHLPLLLLVMPMVATVLAPMTIRWLTFAAAMGLLVFALMIVAHNRSRPIFDAAWRAEPRAEQLLSFQGVRYYEPMREVVRKIMAAGCGDVGLKLTPDHPEYPFWVMLHEAGFKGEVHHELVSGPTARLSGPARMPDVIVTTLSGKPTKQMATAFPTQTEIGPYTLYWSAKLGERTQPANLK
jgi:4-amino-4-deoxy-L-arabinose transferase-like glycosyltransferase